MEKKHYQHFTKLYNRKRWQTVTELEAANYGYVKVTKIPEANSWCKKNCKDGSYIFAGIRIYFAYDKDITRFSLTCHAM